MIIANKPLPLYIQCKDWIVVKYEGRDLQLFIETIFLGLAIFKYMKNKKWKIGISCNNDFISWIPKPLQYYNIKNNDTIIPRNKFTLPIGIYNLHKLDSLSNSSNIISVIKEMNIPFPLDIENIFISKHQSKSVLLTCNGFSYKTLPENIERNIYSHLIQNGYDVTVAKVPYYTYNNFWAQKFSIGCETFTEMVEIISKHEIIISTDNCYLTLANAFYDKKVFGIFGPTIPKTLLKINSMKVIQAVDENPFHVPRKRKVCPCINPRYCHRGYDMKSSPYCLKNISSPYLIKKLKIDV